LRKQHGQVAARQAIFKGLAISPFILSEMCVY